eukprot:CAMPEP_0176155248 /NCGR_PEP_ID=MMETSP0120_2-20121206/79326_1 /TAXON_ID=160619 /ORGANISM="Kryptoperidinium foliaceum, Strain CCMP 1326" /LENGTH=187 /DNA_ID=CAMNT_0017492385 /DNA_START=118 /DNA_END=677 /DNA_ORIENTATION=+
MEKPGVHFVIEEEYIAITLAEGVLAAGVLMHEGQCASIAERGSHRNVVLGMAIVVKVAPHASILVEVGPPHLHVRICDARQAPKHSGVRRLHLAVRPLDLLAAHAASAKASATSSGRSPRPTDHGTKMHRSTSSPRSSWGADSSPLSPSIATFAKNIVATPAVDDTAGRCACVRWSSPAPSKVSGKS